MACFGIMLSEYNDCGVHTTASRRSTVLVTYCVALQLGQETINTLNYYAEKDSYKNENALICSVD